MMVSAVRALAHALHTYITALQESTGSDMLALDKHHRATKTAAFSIHASVGAAIKSLNWRC